MGYFLADRDGFLGITVADLKQWLVYQTFLLEPYSFVCEFHDIDFGIEYIEFPQVSVGHVVGQLGYKVDCFGTDF